MKHIPAAGIVVAITLFAATAWADRNEEQAFEHFEDGAKDYAGGHFRDAIENFQKGFALLPHPMFQVNIAIAHWRLEELGRALDAADLAIALQAQLEPAVAAENQARRHTFSAIVTTRERADAIAADLVAAAEADAETEVVAVPVAPAKRSSFGTAGWIGVAVAGAGAATLGGWGVAESGLTKHVEAVEAAGERGDRAAYDAELETLKSKQGTARILLASGVGLLALGGGLIVYELASGGRDQGTANRVRLRLGLDAIAIDLAF